MSIKGFIISGSTQKYDYNGLDNKPVIPSGGGGEVTDALKSALLQLAEKIAYIDANGSAYYDDLYQALYGTAPTTYSVANDLTAVTNSNPATRVAAGGSYSGTLTASTGYTINTVTITMGGNDVTGTSYSGGIITIPNVTGNIVITAVATERQATLTSISAVFTQGQAVIYNTDSLDTLKQYLVVTAYYDDTSSEVLASSAYTLSGTLTVGTSTITASYGGKSDTFNVTVTNNSLLYNWDFTQSLVDSVSGKTAVLAGGATRDSSGVSFDANQQCIILTNEMVTIADRTVIMDIPSAILDTTTTNHMRVFSSSSNSNGNCGSGAATFCYRYSYGWDVYSGSAWGTALSSSDYPASFFNNKRLKIYIGSNLQLKISYAAIGSDSFTEINTFTTAWAESYRTGYLVVGSYNSNTLKPFTISALKIYEGEV